MPQPKSPPWSRTAIVERSTEIVHNGFLKVAKRVLDVPRADGPMMLNVDREILRRADAAAALVHDVKRDRVLLVELFRFPAYDRGEVGWLTEIPAGVIEPNETPEDAIRRELMEEVGYAAPKLVKIAAVYMSPGYSTERMHIYYAPVRKRDAVDPSARGVDHGEDIARVWMPRKDFLKSLATCSDAKTLIAGLWLARR
ncbi:MAG: NUDIX hydrolase [Hyphomonadaceae bacterium]|nr:NUDIX hydrolase [Hyphomonadaceae bacterium]